MRQGADIPLSGPGPDDPGVRVPSPLIFAAAFALGLFLEQDATEWEPADQPYVRILRVKDGQRIDLDALLGAFAALRAAR